MVSIPWTKLGRRMNCPLIGMLFYVCTLFWMNRFAHTRVWLVVHTSVVGGPECWYWYSAMTIRKLIYTSLFSSTRIWVIWRKVSNPKRVDTWRGRDVCQIMVNLDYLASDEEPNNNQRNVCHSYHSPPSISGKKMCTYFNSNQLCSIPTSISPSTDMTTNSTPCRHTCIQQCCQTRPKRCSEVEATTCQVLPGWWDDDLFEKTPRKTNLTGEKSPFLMGNTSSNLVIFPLSC